MLPVARRLGIALMLLGAAACGDTSPTQPSTPTVHTIVFYRQDTGQSYLLNTDGTDLRPLPYIPQGYRPVGASRTEGVLALADANTLVLISPERPTEVDTIINPTPRPMSLVTFSADGRYVLLLSYQQPHDVLIYDRSSQTTDSIPYDDAVEPVLPPTMSPDNKYVAVVGATPLSMFVTVLDLENPARRQTTKVGYSRYYFQPVFGWPRWTSEGLLMTYLRVYQNAPDTIVSARLDPFNPGDFVNLRFEAALSPVSDARPELNFGDYSTYAYSPDGESMILGAWPADTASQRHALYLVTSGVPRVQLVLDDPTQYPMYPLFIN